MTSFMAIIVGFGIFMLALLALGSYGNKHREELEERFKKARHQLYHPFETVKK